MVLLQAERLKKKQPLERKAGWNDTEIKSKTNSAKRQLTPFERNLRIKSQKHQSRCRSPPARVSRPVPLSQRSIFCFKKGHFSEQGHGSCPGRAALPAPAPHGPSRSRPGLPGAPAAGRRRRRSPRRASCPSCHTNKEVPAIIHPPLCRPPAAGSRGRSPGRSAPHRRPPPGKGTAGQGSFPPAGT